MLLTRLFCCDRLNFSVIMIKYYCVLIPPIKLSPCPPSHHSHSSSHTSVRKKKIMQLKFLHLSINETQTHLQRHLSSPLFLFQWRKLSLLLRALSPHTAWTHLFPLRILSNFPPLSTIVSLLVTALFIPVNIF